MKSLNKDAWRKHIGFALSSNEIFQGTLLENIRMGRENVDSNRINEAIEITNLLEYISSLDLGLKTELDPEGKNSAKKHTRQDIISPSDSHKAQAINFGGPTGTCCPGGKT